jgi:uncharacterized membrane protein YukC
MKKYLLFTILSLICFSSICVAQEANETATAKTSTQKKAFALAKNASVKTKPFIGTTNEQDARCYPVFYEYYNAKLKLESIKDIDGNIIPLTNESLEKLMQERNEKLRKILTPDQMKIWQSVLEPVLIKDENK